MSKGKEQVRDGLIKDCFGNVPGREHCCVLIEDVCLYGDCAFYKTKAQYDAGRGQVGSVPAESGNSVGKGRSRRIRCVENGRVYSSIREAAKTLGISEGVVSLAVRKKQSATHGLSFEYID